MTNLETDLYETLVKRFGKNKNNGEAKIASFYGQLFTCFAVMPMVLYGIIKLFPEVEILNED